MARERATEAFIRDRLRLAPVPLLPEIRLYMAHSGSGLGRFVAARDGATAAPYWAYPWAGGAASFAAPMGIMPRGDWLAVS